MIFLKKVVGVYYGHDRLDIEVIGRTLTESVRLGGISLTELGSRDSLMMKSELINFFDEHKVTPDYVAVALSPDQVAYRHISLPAEVEDNLEQAIRLQMLNVVPSDLDDYCVEKIVRKSDDGKTYEVDVYVVPRDKVRNVLDFLRPLGLHPMCLTLSSFGFEKMLSRNPDLEDKAVFVLDLDKEEAGIHLFTGGRFTAFKQARLDVETAGFDDILHEVEQCAALERVPEDADIELLVNIADPAWGEKLRDREDLPLRFLSDLSVDESAGLRDLRPEAAALQAFGKQKKAFNLLPEDWRSKAASISLVPTLVLAAGVILLLLLNVGRVYIQEAQYVSFLERQIQTVRPQYAEVMKVRQDISRIRKEIETYKQVMGEKSISDLAILRELTEKATDKTYLQRYVRTDKLDIQGFTDSYLELEKRFDTIPFFKSIIPQGSITRRGDLEQFHFTIQLEDKR